MPPLTNTPVEDDKAGEEKAAPKPAITKIVSLEQLACIIRDPKIVKMGFGGSLVSIEVRALSGNQWDEINKIGADIRPPNKLTKAGQVIPGEYNDEDPAYQKAATAAYSLRRAAVFDLGFMTVPGKTIEEKQAYLKEAFTPQAVDAIYASIRSLTSDPIALAHFITDAA